VWCAQASRSWIPLGLYVCWTGTTAVGGECMREERERETKEWRWRGRFEVSLVADD